jgi:hypothetical protein
MERVEEGAKIGINGATNAGDTEKRDIGKGDVPQVTISKTLPQCGKASDGFDLKNYRRTVKKPDNIEPFQPELGPGGKRPTIAGRKTGTIPADANIILKAIERERAIP